MHRLEAAEQFPGVEKGFPVVFGLPPPLSTGILEASVDAKTIPASDLVEAAVRARRSSVIFIFGARWQTWSYMVPEPPMPVKPRIPKLDVVAFGAVLISEELWTSA
ncbi:hypothetical protein GTA08_BOTSDO07295 [Botryosphaeria dothidea]|uniref:Uncharacterized protein n=1 Tax=Botryosphaeria dothidea TaxID=55169 RepID=A0A8H4MZ73_9PEZI|nr:hypothetical protein GTA08_BOTSDO11487 [Botryosphaeria dothidea]KAF4305754.1 hypothetical protein GTA08_BOTSDO07295 [Botryosphaeria dothidea]